jgi:hypothetical protein
MPDASHTSLLLGAIGLGVYLVALVSAVVIATKWRWRPLALVAMFGGLILVGSVAAFDAGRAGPASVVVIQQATVIEQFADTRGSLVSGRAVAEFPMYDHFELQSSVIDGAIDLLPTPRDRSEHRENEGGHPIVAGVFGSGATQAFSLDAATDLQFFTIVRAGPVLTVANVSGAEFTDCRFGSRATTDLQILGTLGPGARASTDQANGMDDPTLTCVTQSSLLEFSDPRHPVTTSGSTLVIVHLTPETAP